MNLKVRTRSELLLWIGSNILVLATLPPLFASWVRRSVQEEYRLGYRTGTEGDSIAIPVAGFTLLLVSLVIAVNVALGLIWLIRRARKKHRAVEIANEQL